MTLSSNELWKLPTREYAERGHRCIGESEAQSHDPSCDAIGGAYGIAWYAAFEDENGKRYKVYCTDGERGGRGPYRDEDEADDQEPENEREPECSGVYHGRECDRCEAKR